MRSAAQREPRRLTQGARGHIAIFYFRTLAKKMLHRSTDLSSFLVLVGKAKGVNDTAMFACDLCSE